ncbi:hypothetical protein R1sor_024957 [Riccia sorocarpa]|uniref:Major facilitator superfamily (MFS) profile domain-containing protein n=1 Tax=Riccia sorocarpa TaxID=122646 RepID=A0ABD3GB37_9MARC
MTKIDFGAVGDLLSVCQGENSVNSLLAYEAVTSWNSYSSVAAPWALDFHTCRNRARPRALMPSRILLHLFRPEQQPRNGTMAGGGVVAAPSGKQYEGRVTLFVAMACIVAASGGLIFGYDIGISGGVTSMDSFLGKFFPSIVRHRRDRNNYCRYDNQGLQIFTSSLYLAGLVATFFASWTTRNWGRRPSMLIGGISFLIGAILNAAAQNLAMLIIGRIMLGIGVGFGNQTVPLYLSEMAPTKLRGALNIMFQMATTLGILAASLINYGTGRVNWGWRLSLGLAAVPASILTLGGLLLPETPNNLIERSRLSEGRAILERIRGTPNVDAEYDDIVLASEQSKAVQHPFRNLFRRQYAPQLSVALLIPFFQQLTGINAIMFYAPVIFRTIGFGNDASLYSAVITGAVNVVATSVSIATVDRYGRKILFYEGGIQMLIAQILIGVILKYKLPLDTNAELGKGWAAAVVVLICVYVAAFAWSWGPLGWLVPSEVFPLEIRSAAQSVTVGTNFLFTFVIGQAFLTMLCHFRWGIFLFFAGWVLIMTLYVAFFLPETKNTPIEEMSYVWKNHWFWKRYVVDGNYANDLEKHENGKL